jgi:TatD DNase family protein
MTIDAHLHLDMYAPAEREADLERAFAAGVSAVVCVSTNPDSCRINEELAKRYPGRIVPAYGQHPEQPPLSESDSASLCRWINERPRLDTFAIGEVGLPYFLRKDAEVAGQSFDQTPYVRQLDCFVALAAKLDRPLALHAVHEDADTTMDLLEKYEIRRAHFHWFKGGTSTVERLIRNGHHISLTPEVLYDEETRHLARTYPLELLMVETDGPWPFEGPYAGRPTAPEMVIDSVKEIAAIRGMDETKVRTILENNTRAFYGLPLLS